MSGLEALGAGVKLTNLILEMVNKVWSNEDIEKAQMYIDAQNEEIIKYHALSKSDLKEIKILREHNNCLSEENDRLRKENNKLKGV
ncbi:hypothetical protein OAD88_07005 [Flavobacteriaceae bacterium]|nr:hypothetical protein [Flavobacteriaceae bacterium]